MKYVNSFITNKLVTHDRYEEILNEYNSRFKKQGSKLNSFAFYNEVIEPIIGRENYSLSSWYQFIRRAKDPEIGMMAAKISGVPVVISPDDPIVEMGKDLMASDRATALGIQSVLNIGAEAAKELAAHPELLPLKQRIELFLKAMKAQDSRIQAMGKISEERRENMKMDQAFGNAAFQQ